VLSAADEDMRTTRLFVVELHGAVRKDGLWLVAPSVAAHEHPVTLRVQARDRLRVRRCDEDLAERRIVLLAIVVQSGGACALTVRVGRAGVIIKVGRKRSGLVHTIVALADRDNPVLGNGKEALACGRLAAVVALTLARACLLCVALDILDCREGQRRKLVQVKPSGLQTETKPTGHAESVQAGTVPTHSQSE
jgi:hypothetical protein